MLVVESFSLCARAHTHTQKHIVNNLPSDYSTLQVINLDKFSKATGVVVMGCLGISESLRETKRTEKWVSF